MSFHFINDNAGGVASDVSIDAARTLSIYSAELQVTGSGTDIKAGLPSGATVSDWAIKCTAGKVTVGSSASGQGIPLEVGQGLTGSNDYSLFVRAVSSDEDLANGTVVVLISYEP